MAKFTRQESSESRPAPRSAGGASRRARRNRKRVDHGPALLRALLLIVFVCLIVWLSVDKRFNIKRVRVDGLHTVKRSEILQLARVDAGRNLFIYSLLEHRAIDRRIEKGEPAVSAAHVRLKLPNTLIVRVQERLPFAQIRINSGPLLLIDETGVPYRIIPARDPDLPAIIAPASTPVPALGKKLDLRLEKPLGAAFWALSLLEHGDYFVPLKLREVQVRSDLYTSVVMRDRPMVHLGLPVDFPEKLATAAAAIDSDPVRAQAASYVDVTLPTKPAIKMKDTASKPI